MILICTTCMLRSLKSQAIARLKKNLLENTVFDLIRPTCQTVSLLLLKAQIVSKRLYKNYTWRIGVEKRPATRPPTVGRFII